MKESEVIADIECPVYLATISELKNFKELIKKLQLEFSHASAVKVTVSRRYKEDHLNKIDKNSIRKDFHFDHVSFKKPEKIKNSKNGIAYEVTTEKETDMDYVDFQKIINPTPDLTVEEKEDLIWKKLFKEEEVWPYMVDQELSLFPKQCKVMNLNKFTYAESILHSKTVEYIKGIQKSTAYIGQFYTVFAFHIEFFDLFAINFLHCGDEKIWYVVPHTEQEKLENLMNHFGISLGSICDKVSKHKTIMIPPSVLKRNGIKYTKIVQKPNEFVIIFPGGYHSGFNCGFNIAEGINFANDSWLDRYPKYTLCDCIDFNEDTLKLKPILDNMYNREIELRKKQNSLMCDICLKTFKNKKYIARHMNNHKESVKRFPCTHCNKSYSRKEKLQFHIRDNHANITMPKQIEPKMVKNVSKPNKGKYIRPEKVCPHCDKKFSQASAVIKHLTVCQALKR